METINSTLGNDNLTGTADDDTIVGSFGDDSLIGGLNNDLLLGGNGRDWLVGVDPDLGFGAGETDTLTGGGGGDTFVLGAGTEVFYNDEGNSDFALINNFNISQDRIQVPANPEPFSVAETGDAGQLVPSAQVIPAGRATPNITGTISSENDVDLFQITLNGGTFSATTVGGADFDTQLFLFDENGFLVDQNDNVASGNQSALPESPRTPLDAGTYFLAISSSNKEPVGAPLSGFTGNGNSSGSYTINLTGVDANPISLSASPAGFPSGTAVSFENDLIAIVQGVPTINGTLGNDNLTGTADEEVISGFGGNDLLNGLDGDDTLNGDSGNDTLVGGLDDDSLNGGSGSDSVNGENGEDFVLGGADDDTVVGSSGDDSLIGGLNNDLLLGGNGSDRLIGADPNLRFRTDEIGTGEIDTLTGGDGSDTFVLGASSNGFLYDEVFYDHGGNSDFALIEDFNLSQDFIELPVDPEPFSVAETDDAGQLLPDAQVISAGTARLESITGTISSENDVDLFQITLDDETSSSFYASTFGQADFDTQLFLFNENGFLVDQNDNGEFTSSNQSTLLETSKTPLDSGTYFLAISSSNNDPVGAQLSGFTGNGNSSGSYTINLSGVQANPYNLRESPAGLPSGTAISFDDDLIAIVQGVSTDNLTDDVIIPLLRIEFYQIAPVFAFAIPFDFVQ